MKLARYAIQRVWEGDHLYYTARDTVAYAPTIDEAHTWIQNRIKQAGAVGLRLRPLDFEVDDTWDTSNGRDGR